MIFNFFNKYKNSTQKKSNSVEKLSLKKMEEELKDFKPKHTFKTKKI